MEKWNQASRFKYVFKPSMMIIEFQKYFLNMKHDNEMLNSSKTYGYPLFF